MSEKRTQQQYQELDADNWNSYLGYNEPDGDWGKVVEPGGLSNDDTLPGFTYAKNRWSEILNAIKGKRILIIGDIMLDHYIYGKMERQSPEANVPIFDVEKEEYHLGGAGNVAMNVVGLGGECSLVGLVGVDDGADWIRFTDHSRGLELFEVDSHDRPTTVKTRLICNSQQVMRIDRESTAVANKREQDLLFEMIGDINEYDAVIFSDYDKGVIFPELIHTIMNEANHHGIPIIADPKYRNFWNYQGVTAMTPNTKELESAFTKFPDGMDDLFSLVPAEFPHILETKGDKGMALHHVQQRNIYHGKAHDVDVKDVCGAGDTVTAAFALVLSANVEIRKAAEFANKAASISVQRYGCYAPKPEDFD